MIFVDASAIVAILAGEPDAERLLQTIQNNETMTSPLALFEAALGLSRQTRATLGEARDDLREFLVEAKIREIGIRPEDFVTALEAARRFGKGRGHPAQLNLGDCFAYACAKNANARLLFKGNDFIRTDIPSASD